MTNSTDIARAMADTMAHAAIPMYGKKLRLPDRSAIISLIKELRRLFFPAYFGDPQLMALPAENYAALLLERIETALTTQIALALPEEEASQASRITQSIVAELPRIQQVLLTDIEATFDGDPAAANKEEIIFAYPGLFAIFVYRIAHELYLRQVPMIPRMMTEYAHSRTGIDIHPGAQIGPWFFIDHGTGIVIGETTVIGSHVKLYQGVTLGALSPRAGHAAVHQHHRQTALPRQLPPCRPRQPAGQAPPHRVRLCHHLLRRVHSGRQDRHRRALRSGGQRLPHRLRGRQHPGCHHRAGDGVQERLSAPPRLHNYPVFHGFCA